MSSTRTLTRALAAVAAAAAVAVVLRAANPAEQDPAAKEDPKAAKEEPKAEPKKEPPDRAAKTAADRELYRPLRTPDRVILTWKDDPATTQAVTWRTDTTVTQAKAEIALADPTPGVEKEAGAAKGWMGYNPDKVRSVPARTEKLKTAVSEAHYHSAQFDGLKPRTKYMYRVGDGVVWSEWFQFETASDRPEPFGFIYYGDAQNGIKSLWSRVARGAYSDMPKAKFVVHAGDLVDRGANDLEWGEWHTGAGWINGMVPSVPTPGNHEYAGKAGITAHWRPQFALPENGPPGLEETCYYLDYQGVRVISLNSNEKVPEQAPWLEQVLSTRPPSIRWTVVTFHHPVYATAATRQKKEEDKAVRVHWRPVFDRHAPDLVLQGHDHSYGRSGLMREDNRLDGERARSERGTVYVVSVSGAKMYPLGEQPWMVNPTKGEGVQLYQLVRVDGDRLTYEARTAAGDRFDAFELRKRPDGGNDLVELGGAGPADVGSVAAPAPGRDYWNAAGGAVIGGAVVAGVWFALRRRPAAV